jgi:hypothetical protein
MTFQIAFHKYSCCLHELNSHSCEHEWICEELSSEQPDGSYQLIGVTDTLVAQVRPDGSCVFKPMGE